MTTTSIPVFDQLRATVTAGPHVVARFPGVLLVIRRGESGTEDAVPALLQLCRDVTAVAPRSPGRALARRLTGWLAQNEQAPGFGTLAATEDGVAVFLYGEVAAWAEGLELSGSTAAFTVDRLVDWPTGPLMLAADGITIAEDAGPDWLGLHRGVVDGGGTTLHPAPDAAWLPAMSEAAQPPPPPAVVGPPETELSLPVATPAPPDPEVSGIVAPPPSPPALSDRIFGVAPDEPPRAPLPVAAPVAAPAHDHPPAPGRPPAPPTGFAPPASSSWGTAARVVTSTTLGSRFAHTAASGWTS